jgi:zinc/manganese transport system substrate-binding protein
MKLKIILLSLISFLMTFSLYAERKLEIVTTTSDLASLVQEIGKDRVNIVSLSSGTRDPHFIEPRPSMVMKLKRADLVVLVGMDLDIWIESLLDTARNYSIKFGNSGYLDVSESIEKLEIPQGKIDGSMGHVHPQGNPHYWLDPENTKIMAKSITQKLIELSPASASFYETNFKNFSDKMDKNIMGWQATLNPYKNEKIITYHRSWPYFANRFGLDIIDEIEPKPGIPPSPGHLREVLKRIKQSRIKVVLMEMFYDPKPAQFLASQTNIKVVAVPNSVGGIPAAKDYFSLMDIIVNKLAKALEPTFSLPLKKKEKN